MFSWFKRKLSDKNIESYQEILVKEELKEEEIRENMDINKKIVFIKNNRVLPFPVKYEDIRSGKTIFLRKKSTFKQPRSLLQ